MACLHGPYVENQFIKPAKQIALVSHEVKAASSKSIYRYPTEGAAIPAASFSIARKNPLAIPRLQIRIEALHADLSFRG